MRLRGIEREEPAMNLVGMVDVIFLLVIFWMLVTALGVPAMDGRIAPPPSRLPAERAPLTPHVLQVPARVGEQVRLAGRAVPDAELEPVLRSLPEGPVLLRADAAAEARRVAWALAQIRHAGRSATLSVRRREAQP